MRGSAGIFFNNDYVDRVFFEGPLEGALKQKLLPLCAGRTPKFKIVLKYNVQFYCCCNLLLMWIFVYDGFLPIYCWGISAGDKNLISQYEATLLASLPLSLIGFMIMDQN